MVLTVNKDVMDHLRKDVVYPATKKDVIEACNGMQDVSQQDKEWYTKNLPDWNYRNYDEIVRAVQLVDHLGRISFPITRKDLIKTFEKMPDITKNYREWFERNLPDRSYNSSDQILGMLKGVVHVREHIIYPATKTTILETCNNMAEVPTKEWFEKLLPEKTYNNSDDVIKAFKM